ncbi:MAG: hypothetical protein HY036_01670 [Nitrospirae bacterium]|nr:hypothetical protein [Nitrospirota bacterium]
MKKLFLKVLKIKHIDLFPLKWHLLLLFTRSIGKEWGKPYCGFWEQNRKTYFLLIAGPYYFGMRFFT